MNPSVNPFFASGMLAMEAGALQKLLAYPDAAAAPAAGAASRVLTENAGVATIAVRGPLAPSDSIFLRWIGGTSLESIHEALETALARDSVKRILLSVDSPGGQVNGISELADAIRKAHQRKPVIAFAAGMAASAGYWLASAAGKIIASDTSMLGSLGVCAVILDARPAYERAGLIEHEIVSSQSPNKRPDVATDAGRALIQQNIDSLAQVFLNKVAGFRGMSVDTLVKNGRHGGLLVGAEAVRAGLADAVGRFEAATIAPTVTAAATLQDRWNADASLRAEFGTFDTYRAFAAADAAGRVSIHKSGVIHHGRF
jgi:signal peptide peptidase SppA